MKKSSFARKAAWTVTIFAFISLYFPIALMAAYSFFDPASGSWTMHWYSVALSNQLTLEALKTSLFIGVFSTLGATVLGTSGAIALERTTFRGRSAFAGLVYLPLILPEIVMGLSLLLWFVMLHIPLGSFCVILGHITFSLSYVLITVRSRLQDFDPALEEAARDLGATSWQAFWKVTLPVIFPAVLSGALIAFTLSFDDFLVTFFTAGVGSDTLPVRIYSMIKYGLSPEIHALSCLMIAATFFLVAVVFKPKTR